VRCFIGLALPLEARESLAAALVPLRSTLGRLSWTASENYHLTLAFLGELEAPWVELAAAALDSAARFGEIAFSFAGLGSFPPRGALRVLYARLAEGGVSAKLQRIVAKALAGAGFPPRPGGEKPFTPHITLARANSGRGPVLRSLPAIAVPGGAWTLGRCSLYKSLLLRSGAVYTELRGVDLAPR